MSNMIIRRAEHTHTVKCASAAMIAAIENIRDTEGVTDHEFILEMQDNPWYIGREYLVDGTASCQCNSDGKNPCMRSCCDYGLVDGIKTIEDGLGGEVIDHG